jgi:hypothetical protein
LVVVAATVVTAPRSSLGKTEVGIEHDAFVPGSLTSAYLMSAPPIVA